MGAKSIFGHLRKGLKLIIVFVQHKVFSFVNYISGASILGFLVVSPPQAPILFLIASINLLVKVSLCFEADNEAKYENDNYLDAKHDVLYIL